MIYSPSQSKLRFWFAPKCSGICPTMEHCRGSLRQGCTASTPAVEAELAFVNPNDMSIWTTIKNQWDIYTFFVESKSGRPLWAVLYHHRYRAYIKFLYQDHDTRSYITIVNVQWCPMMLNDVQCLARAWMDCLGTNLFFATQIDICYIYTIYIIYTNT